jgi:outer membrane protein OmpA-like peptidoglycan-associated protein/Mg-chelatase subunit ChlD
LYLKTIEVTDTLTGLQVHLLDKNGTYYYGAAEPEWRHIWKNLLLQDQKGKIQEIKNFRVFEYSQRDNLPTALAIVMDHSGSMGEQRARVLQEGAKMLIAKKDERDALTIIKYDSKIGVEVPLSKTEKRLNTDLKVNGLSKYGGATSLLDAIEKGVQVLKNAKGYKRKAVIILTDGNENSSIASKGQVLKTAAGNEVSIFTIGFGDYVSEDYLKALAYYSQGSYYQIYKTSDFNWVFDDVYKKTRNYYSIRFETDTIGEYSALLEIALDENRRDELTTTFNNTPFDFDLLDESDFDYDFKAPVSQIKPSEFVMKDLKTFKDSIVKVTNETAIAKKEQHKKEQKEDFSKINFPNIQFYYSEVKIIEGSEKGIEEVVSFMKKYSDVEIEIIGHTDNVGNSEDNQMLSLARAKAVKMLLEKAGIKERRIHTQGLGDTQPLESNKTK